MSHIADLPIPASPNGKDVVVPATRSEWRRWLEENPERTEGIWVIFRNDKAPLDGPLYAELVEEALCFGWIDSVVKSVDQHRRIQWFSPRRPGSIWSALTKERIARLESEGLMSDRGRAAIETARQNGTWSQYDPVEALIVPSDLGDALTANGARDRFDQLTMSARKAHLWSVYSAKLPQTREKRILVIVEELKPSAQE